ncbi:MAG: tRNA-dihydrouridine synthase family protein [Acetatifactor sp.]|nr:tRNA-dihydrouridine synthase family protein [Acetatifactor sp.]
MEFEQIKDISLAPMEGVTGPVFRRVHKKHFTGVDRYFTPFLAANKTHHFKRRETREFLPFDPGLVPQVLTSSAEDFIWAAKALADAGYKEVNINLGCPMATVVTKHKGAGMLLDRDYLERFFDTVFSESDMPRISVKTRLGFSSPDEAVPLGKLYGAYPFSEVVIHARVREDFYNKPVNLSAFSKMAEQLSCPVCYNGDIRSILDLQVLMHDFPTIDRVMIGRGLLANPALAGKIRNYESGTDNFKEYPSVSEIERYLSDLWNEYSQELSGDRDVLFKMKELWFHMGSLFPKHQKALDTIRKCKTSDEYHRAVDQILSTSFL